MLPLPPPPHRLCRLPLLGSSSAPDDQGDDDYDYPNVPPPPPPAPCNPVDRNTLLRIKKALNNSVVMSSWNPGTDCCNLWDFVFCEYSTGRVINLSFYGNGWGHDDLPPIIPPPVGDLPYLESLRFYNNAVGPIPGFLANLQNLQTLYLSHNHLSGPIPDFFSRMQNLSWLELSGNQLTGPIPPSLGYAPSLYVLNLNSNRLTGRIPSSLGNMPNINDNVIKMDLSYNLLDGPIPESFGGVNFRSLFLTGNSLTGDASFIFGKNKEVWLIDLSGNKLEFNMSNIEIPPQLAWLGLSQNQIYGGLPPGLTNVDLDYLNVSYNHLCGPIPQGGSLQKFDQTAYFHNDCLCGNPLPQC